MFDIFQTKVFFQHRGRRGNRVFSIENLKNSVSSASSVLKKCKLMKSTYGYKMENLVSSHFLTSQDVLTFKS